MDISSAEYTKHKQTLMTINSSWAIAPSASRPVIYSLVFIVISLPVAWLFLAAIPWGFSISIARALYIAAFGLLGTVQIFSFSKWLPHLHTQDGKNAWLYSILLAMLAAIANFLLFIFMDYTKPQLAFSGGCAFLLPTAIVQSRNYFLLLSPITYPPWHIPAAAPPKKMVAQYLNNLTVNIQLKINYSDAGERSFLVMVPERLALGKMFHQFLKEREEFNTNVQLADRQHQPYAWRFYLKRPLSIKMLDPALTLIENNIKQKDTILTERIVIS